LLSELGTGKKVVGIKQSRKAIREGFAQKAYLAADADPKIREELSELCRQEDIPLVTGMTMQELGKACGIEVGAAIAVVLG